MLVNYYTLLNLLQIQNNNKFIDLIDTLHKKDSYISYDEVINFIETEKELESVIHSLKFKQIMFVKDGLIRILLNWETLYKSCFKTFISQNKLSLSEDDLFSISDDQINKSRKALREKDYYTYLKLAIENYYLRLNKLKEYSVAINKIQSVDFVELKNNTLSQFEISIYY